MTDWQPLVVSLLVSLLIGIPGMALLFFGTLPPRKHHLMNVFS